MAWKEDMYEALADFVRSKGNDVVEVTGIEQDSSTRYQGCETCGYGGGTEYETEIYYTTSEGRSLTYYYSGSFTDLIDYIT